MSTRTIVSAGPTPEVDPVCFLETGLDAIFEKERIFNLEVYGDPTGFASGHFLIDTHAYESEEFWLTFHAPDIGPVGDGVPIPHAISWQTFKRVQIRDRLPSRNVKPRDSGRTIHGSHRSDSRRDFPDSRPLPLHHEIANPAILGVYMAPHVSTPRQAAILAAKTNDIVAAIDAEKSRPSAPGATVYRAKCH